MIKQPLILGPSYLFAGFLGFTHLGAIIAVLSLGLSWLITLPLMSVVIVSLIKNINRYALQRSPKSIIKIWPQEQVWLLQDQQGNCLTAELSDNNYRSLYLTLLNFKILPAKTNLAVVIFPDTLAAQHFRRLRAQLLFQRKPKTLATKDV